MRTTVEITNQQRIELTKLAAERGLRGFSQLVREAIDRYLADQREADLDEVLALRGILTDEEADEWERRIGELREAPARGEWS